MADIFDVVADPTRRQLLQILLERLVEGADAPHGGESSVGELVVRLGLSQPTVSKHLKVLRDCALVTVREQGQHRFYRLDPGPLGELEDWVAPFLPRPTAVEEAPEEPDGRLPDLLAEREAAAALPGRSVPRLGSGAQGMGELLGRGVAGALHSVRRAGRLGRR